MKLGSLFALIGPFFLVAASVHGGTVPAQKEWVWLIFLNGHNNLSSYGDLNINQLETVGSTNDVDVVVQWAKQGASNTYRLRVEKDNDMSKVSSPMLETLPRQDMGDYHNLVEFVRWSAAKFPAKRYFVSYWNHGSGWHRQDRPRERGVSFDDYSGNHITTEQMGIAAREIAQIIGHKVDIVGADACLMAMSEVGSEMADDVEIFVASEETEPGLGWPYHTFLARWAANPLASSAEISGYLVDEYHKYLGPSEDITLSAMDLRHSRTLWDGMGRLSSALLLLQDSELRDLKVATGSAVKFAYPDYVDLGDWLRKAASLKGTSLDKLLLKNVSDSVSQMVVANKTTAKYADAAGVAFWVPPTKGTLTSYASLYERLRFSRETRWLEVLKRIAGLPVCHLQSNGQWASDVLAVSSEYGTSTWSAKQVTGACDTPEYGDYGTAWAPKLADGSDESITVSFATPVYSVGAVIRESFSGGFVTQIEALDEQGDTHLVWQGTDPSVKDAISDFEISWPKTSFLVRGLKVTVSTQKTLGWEEIDSIQLLSAP